MYKYLSPESIDFILTSKGVNLRFSQPEILNDPFELKPSLSSFSSEIKNNLIKSGEPFGHESNRYFQAIEKEYIDSVVAEFTEATESYLSNSLNSTIGILSLSKSPQSRCMWSYYAKDHTGFIICFNYSEGDKYYTIDNHNFADVLYSQSRTENYELSTKSSNNDLLLKDSEWKHENEIRSFIDLKYLPATRTDPNGYPLHCKDFPVEHINKIILGARSDKILERKVKFWVDNYATNVIIEKAIPCKNEYKLNYELIYKR